MIIYYFITAVAKESTKKDTNFQSTSFVKTYFKEQIMWTKTINGKIVNLDITVNFPSCLKIDVAHMLYNASALKCGSYV